MSGASKSQYEITIMNDIKLVDIVEADNGDIIYDFDVSPAAQKAIYKSAKALKITQEEFLKLCIKEKIEKQ